MSRRRALHSERNLGRPLTRSERDNLAARLAVMSRSVAAGFADLALTAGGRARLRDAGYCARLSPAEVRAASRAGAGVPEVAGVPVDLEAIVRGLSRTPRGRTELWRRGMTP